MYCRHKAGGGADHNNEGWVFNVDDKLKLEIFFQHQITSCKLQITGHIILVVYNTIINYKM